MVPPENLPGLTTEAQLGHRKAGTDETTGEETKLPKTRSPEEYALQNARRHPRGFVRCQMAPEQKLRNPSSKTVPQSEHFFVT
jgi:hypothetical protein